MSKIPLVALGLLLLGVLRLQSAGFGWAEGLLAESTAVAPAPAYADSIGTPAPVALSEAIDFTGWFPAEAAPRESAVWRAIDAAAVEAGTPAGWAALCKQASAAVGGDRTADLQLGALACSADVAVTGLQGLALQVLATQAAVALWMTGEPGFVASPSTDARASSASPARLACSLRTTSIRPSARPALQPSISLGRAVVATQPWPHLGRAYGAIASEIALRDPETDLEPAMDPSDGAADPATGDPAAGDGAAGAADDTADAAP